MNRTIERNIDTPETSSWNSGFQYCRDHPYATLLVAIFIFGGAIVGAYLPIAELSVARRAMGGAVAGAHFMLYPLGARMFLLD